MMRELSKGLLAGGRFGLLLAGLTVALLAAAPASARAQIRLEAAYGDASLRGPAKSLGAVVWSHGRSVESEDSEAPTPLYMSLLREAGWDVYRLNRMRVSDTLPNSSRALAAQAERLKGRGYQQVVATGQSFGAFISLIAAGMTNSIDAVVGTAPAAYGNFSEAYDSYRENATQLWPILRNVRTARVMLFFFHGDDFDPGGRGDAARTILASKGIDHVIIDQPANLTGHGAATTGLFVRRFGACILRFSESGPRPTDPPCDDSWGRAPSPGFMRAALSGGQPAAPRIADTARPFLGAWYGTYLNGRELVLNVDRAAGDAVYAEYVLGPGVEPGDDMERVRRTGRLDGDALVFDEKGRNILRYRLRPDGKLAATWLDKNGNGRLDTVLRRVE